MKILYFGSLKDRLGLGEEDVKIPDGISDLRGLVDWMRSRSETHAEAFASLDFLRAAINQEHVHFDAPIAGAYEIAFFPPVTGG